MQSQRPIILTFLTHYLPGYQWGGPLRAIENLVDHLGDEFDFRIVCKDRDVADDKPYEGIIPDTWNKLGKALIYYLSPASLSWRGFHKVLKETDYNILYLNSFFEKQFSILPLLIRNLTRVKKTPIVLANRGEFTYGGLNIKPLKKKIYLSLVKKMGLLNGIVWQASTHHEVQDIRRIIGADPNRIREAIELPPILKNNSSIKDRKLSAEMRPLRVLYLSRISQDKNFEYAVRVISKVRVPVEFNIYGPISDTEYWQKCRKIMETFPENIHTSYRGPVAHADVLPIYAKHDLFFLPTFGENYCYAIAESLSMGTPVLIADTSLWRDLENQEAGWDLPLKTPEKFVEKIELLASMSTEERQTQRQKAQEYYANTQSLDQALHNNRNLFLKALK